MATLFTKSLRSLAIAALVASLLFGGSALAIMGRLYHETNSRALAEAAMGLAAVLPEPVLTAFEKISNPEEETLREDAQRLAKEWVTAVDSGSHFRLTLIGRDGSVVVDSRAEAETMENHGSRPEFAEALQGRPGSARRKSATIGMDLFYAAVPLRDKKDELVGALRVAVDLPSLEARLASARWALIVVILLVALVALAAAALFSRGVATPLARLAEAAKAFSGPGGAEKERAPEKALGLLHRAAIAPGPEEVLVLGKALESMALELASRISAAAAESRERTAILDGISEAVLALDASLCLKLANPAAGTLFELPKTEYIGPGPRLLAATHSSQLEAAAETALHSRKSVETEIALYAKGGERFFQVFATPLPGPVQEEGEAWHPDGVVLVLNDITRLRRLERVRKDFVANVSHELRTPIQLIKGFAETLGEGALADQEKALRFVGIIERNSIRMENLIGDLLTLARLEQEGSPGLQVMEEELGRLIEESIAALETAAELKGISISARYPPGLSARVNAGLLVQALVNLLDNAVKYSSPGSPVSVNARAEGRKLILEVQDRGMGIPAKDLPRIFERFYRVDKARSRELGGTGLGLAIVRHIALAHGGSASVESWEGEGSLFRIILPLDGPSFPEAPQAPVG